METKFKKELGSIFFILHLNKKVLRAIVNLSAPIRTLNGALLFRCTSHLKRILESRVQEVFLI